MASENSARAFQIELIQSMFGTEGMFRRFALTGLMLVVFGTSSVHAISLWTENAENGLNYVIDGTSTDYSLVQSSVVSEGTNAFHLANPSFQDNWFVLDQDITLDYDTKLFFQSRLSWATNAQVAKVQISTDGGATWPTDIYSQMGTGGQGEGSFSLREVNLSSYANQDARFRFYYDFTGGSAFTQTDDFVGWRIDDIQIGSELTKTQYSIGNPSADAQLYLEYINRAREDAIVEAHRLAAETDPDIVSAYNFFNIDTNDIVSQFQWAVDYGHMAQHAEPLAFNEDLNQMAELHTEDMFDNEFQGHVSSANPPAPYMPGDELSDRAAAVGYSGSLGENVYSYADSIEHGHAGFNVDWGNTTNTSSPAYNPNFAGQGMQNPAGHRLSIHNPNFKEAGIGVINGTNSSVGPQLVTQNFGSTGDATFVTGVVFEDLDGDNFYDIGEGRSGVRIDVDGSGFFAISTDSGGYTIPVSGDGNYEVTFSGGGFSDFVTTAIVSNGENVKIDYLVSLLAGDYNGDGFVDAADYTVWRDNLGAPAGTLPNDIDGGVIGTVQYDTWVENYGASSATSTASAVPEPSMVILSLVGFGFVIKTCHRRGVLSDGS